MAVVGLIIVFPLILVAFVAVHETAHAVDAYRATHGGISGTFTVERSTRPPRGGYVTEGLFRSGDGTVQRPVTLDGTDRHAELQRIPARLSDPQAGRAYPPHSAAWITSTVIATIFGMISLATVIGLGLLLVHRLKHRGSVF
jgi:hypothetical protein